MGLEIDTSKKLMRLSWETNNCNLLFYEFYATIADGKTGSGDDTSTLYTMPNYVSAFPVLFRRKMVEENGL
jgi:hypothetical protein